MDTKNLNTVVGSAMQLNEFLDFAISVSATLVEIHKKNLIYGAICPENIIWERENLKAELADHANSNQISLLSATHLPYISPEQTGRINRQVDYRTDLYSLGIILYELFTGQLPFVSSNPMDLIHAHIASKPEAPSLISAEIPDPVSDIILKLMSKNAEDRYQTARGLRMDLENCLGQLKNKKRIEKFELGRDDFTGKLQIPQRLYGREEDIKQLQAVLDQSISGSAQLLLVAGYSGVGKTALVHEIQKDTIAKNAAFVEGKFDQLQRTLPYSAWAQAFTQLVNHWLTGSEGTLAGWKGIILEAVGDQGQILIDIIPALEQVIGSQPEVPRLGDIESQNRFNYVFNKCISNLAISEHPLVVFLDDLQWIDSASLNLIESLLTIQSNSSFLVIGAYRNNEVGPEHPLTASRERMYSEGKIVTTITLEDLTTIDTDQMLADTLQAPVSDCSELGKALVDKTAGNPFYYRQQLIQLESDDLLSFDFELGKWVWQENMGQKLQAGGNVVDLMIRKIQSLPTETQKTLSIAACIGNSFKTSTLKTITGKSQNEIFSDLNLALQNGLVFKLNGNFSFVHDRVQEAGYSLIPQEDLPKTHLVIGRLLLADIPDEKLDEEIFTIVGHLNAGQILIDSKSEKLDLSTLNLKAGQKARNTSAFLDAKTYIEIGLDLLEPNSWQGQYELTLSLFNENAELAASTGQYEQIQPISDLIHNNARSILDQVCIYMIEIEAATMRYDFKAAVDIGLDILRKLDIDIPLQPSSEDYKQLRDKYFDLLTDRPRDVVNGLPEMTDERALAVSEILASELTPTTISRQEIYPLIGLLGANLTLELGHNVWSPVFFAATGNILWWTEDLGTPSDDVLGHLLFTKQMHEISLKIQQDPVYWRSQTRTLLHVCTTGAFCLPIEFLIETTSTTFLSGLETGDLNFGSQGALFYSIYSLAAGMNLDQYRNQIAEYYRLLHQFNQSTWATFLSIFLQEAIAFREPLAEPHRLIGSYFDEDTFLPAAIAAKDISGRHFLYAAKLQLSYHFDVDNELLEYINESKKFFGGAPGLFTISVIHFYSSLAMLRLYPDLVPEDQKQALKQVDNSLQLIGIWSRSVPSTYQHMYDLIRAEKARVLGDIDKALYHYEQAIQGAHKVGFTNDEALANELYARFWVERGNERFATPLMREAHSLYKKWGALAKVEHLVKRYPNLLIGRKIIVDQPGTTIISDEIKIDIDLNTVLKTSQEIASEIVLDRLLVKLMDVVIKNAGAQKGFLIMQKENEWVIEAEGEVTENEIQVLQSQKLELNNAVSSGIVNYVSNTQQNVVLDNAAKDGKFKDDPVIKKHKSKSILCIPLLYQGQVRAILYLQNNLTTGTFTTERVELLKLLSSEMAMALDNAQLYHNLEQSEERFRVTFEQAAVGVAHVGPDGRFLRINQKFCEITGYSMDEMLARTFQDITYPDDLEIDLEHYHRLLRGDSKDYSMEKRYIRKDGSIVWINLTVNLLLRESGDPDFFVSVVEDITERKKVEQEILEYQKKLKDLSNQLILSEEKQRRQIATELHDHVGQILASSRLQIAAINKSMDKEDILKKLKNISGGLNDSINATQDAIFELSPPQLNEIGLAAALSDWMYKELETKHGIKFELSSDVKKYPINKVVRYLLFRCACELLVNVVKHARASKVTVNIQKRNDNIYVSVHDNGSGFNYHPELIKMKNSGFGLLSIHERIENIDGTLQIDTAPGKGTKAVLKLPANN